MAEVKKTLSVLHNNLSDEVNIVFDQLPRFLNAVAPYMVVQDVTDLVDDDTAKTLNKYEFFSLNSCTMEKKDDLSSYLNEKFEKLFTALHSLNSPIVYGVVSRDGVARIVIGVKNSGDMTILQSMIKGMLIGIEVEDHKAEDLGFYDSLKNGKGGFLSAVPILKLGENKQKFDLSTLMRSLNGTDYTVLFYAEPIPYNNTQSKYNDILSVRDICTAVSRHNISESSNDTKTTTQSVSRRGLVPEIVKQIRENKFDLMSYDLSAIIDSIENGSRINDLIANTETVNGLNKSISSDIQNGVALEMVEYCNKAVERLKKGQSIGLWNVTISYAAKGIAADILSACLCGEIAKPVTDILPMNKFDYYLPDNQTIYLPNENGKNLLVPITSAEFAMLCTPPSDVVPNFELKHDKIYPMVSYSGEIALGKISDGYRVLENIDFALSENDLNKHTFVCGITGSGKTTTVKEILRNCRKPFMVIESAKKEYRNIQLKDGMDKPIVYTLGKPEINCYQLNPFYVQCGINLQTHIDFLKDLFNASFSFYGPMPYILEKCLLNIYRKKGWNITLGYHPHLINTNDKTRLFDLNFMQDRYEKRSSKYLFPTMQDLKKEIKRYIEQEMQYEGEVAGNIKTAILARLESLCGGAKGYMFNTNYVPNMKKLMEKNVIFELEGLADDSDKAFAVGLLVIFINEYRQVSKEINLEETGLKHLLVIEEAHRLLKNVSTEKTSEESANPKGKAVEHFTNMIAEMRSYGQGVIIAEQIPSKLAPDVIKNSSNKIVQRLVSCDDQEIVSNTIGLSSEDAVHLGSMKKGVALCHKEGMSLPIRVNINYPPYEAKKSDADLHIINSNIIFDSIDYSVIKEFTSEMITDVSFKVLNSLLSSKPDDVVDDINNAVSLMRSELKKNDIMLINDKSEDTVIYARVLFEMVISFFTIGAYSVKNIFEHDDLVDTLYSVFTMLDLESVCNVKKQLSDAKFGYGENCRNRCSRIIATSIKKDTCKEMDISKTIDGYFFKTPNGFRQEVREKLKQFTE